MNAGNRSEAAWKSGLSRTAECIPVERLDGGLTASERDHLAHCVRCQAEMALWTRMQEKTETPEEAAAVQAVSLEVRRRLGSLPPNVVPVVPRRSRRGKLRLISYAAAAAVVVVIGIGVLVQQREPSIEGPVTGVSTYRSAALEVISPVGESAAAPTALRWKAAAGATAYDVEVLEVDGTLLWRGSTTETFVDLPASVVTKFVPGKSILWQARARRDRAVIADSGTQRFRVSIAQ